MSRYSLLSVDELLDLGARLELALRDIETELDPLALRVEAEGRRVYKAIGKVALSGGAATAGVMAAPFTAGWSLWAAVLPGISAVVEIVEVVGDVNELRPLQRRLKALRREAAEVEETLEAVSQELYSRG